MSGPLQLSRALVSGVRAALNWQGIPIVGDVDSGAGAVYLVDEGGVPISAANPLDSTGAGGGGGGAITAANGAIVNLGAEADTAASLTLLGRILALTARFPAALGAGGGIKVDGSGTPLPVSGTVAATEADGANVAIGTTTDTSAANTVIGRLKKLLSVLPAALGSATSANSLPVVVASDQGAVSTYTGAAPSAVGELQGGTSSTQFATATAKYVKFKALKSNAGNVYVGLATGVTKADGTTDTTTGLELAPGDDSGMLPCTNLNQFWRICDNAGDDVTYMVFA